MKEIFNTLSNVSDFFSEKRNVYKGGKPSPAPFGEGSSLRETFPITDPGVKKLLNTPAAKIKEAQARGAEMQKRIQEKFGEKNKSPEAIAKSKDFKENKVKTLTKLVGELAQKGPESNWVKSFVRGKKGEIKTVIDKKVARDIGNALQNLPGFNLKLAKYYDLVRDELDLKVGEREEYKSPTKSLQRKLESELMTTLKQKASDRVLAYLVPKKMGPVEVEKPTRAQMLAARKKAAEDKRIAARNKRLASTTATDKEIARLIDEATPKAGRQVAMGDRPPRPRQ